jgi:hypothetical protein
LVRPTGKFAGGHFPAAAGFFTGIAAVKDDGAIKSPKSPKSLMATLTSSRALRAQYFELKRLQKKELERIVAKVEAAGRMRPN